ncbi:NDR1/HIN1-like protein 13 [Primulina huaijiensis]|uniref:NDR1/HIN1-like protein 13 n=1 Tax=Primulina huaijiensis TaxID=1492673 RepID=UPI003CC74DDF
MEEREVPPANDRGTYVVQIPRNQVYRIPPPENAHIVEQHTRNFPQKTNKCGFSRLFCWLLLIFILLGIVAGMALLALRATMYNPKSPEFEVVQFLSKNLEQPPLNKNNTTNTNTHTHTHTHTHTPEYDITLHATNPNEKMSVSFLGTGESSLVFKNKKIGHGGAPSSATEEEPNIPIRSIPVTLYGSWEPLTEAIKKSLADSNETKSMQLKIETSIEFNNWARNELKDIVITCDFKVKGSLSKTPKVSSQECRTEL